MAAAAETNDFVHHPIDTMGTWAKGAADEVWTQARSMNTGEWLAAATLVAAGVGGAGYTALRVAGLLDKGLSVTAGATLELTGAAALRDSGETMADEFAIGTAPSTMRTGISTDDAKLAEIFNPDQAGQAAEMDARRVFDPVSMKLTVTNPDTAVGQYQAGRLPEFQRLLHTAFAGLPNYIKNIPKLGTVDPVTQIARVTGDGQIRDIVIRRDQNWAFEQVARIRPGQNQFEHVETRFFDFTDKNVRTWAETNRGVVRSTMANSGRVSGTLLNESDSLAELSPINGQYLYRSAAGHSMIGLFAKLNNV